MQNPKVSFIITVYNAQSFIEQTIQSLQNQTYQNWEAVIVDDGSSDQTVDLIQAQNDARIILIQAGRIGRGKALNTALQKATGNYFAIQDADDYSHPQRLEFQVRVLSENSQIHVLGTDQYIFSHIKDIQNKLQNDGLQFADGAVHDISKQLILKNPLSHTSVIVSRECIEKIGGYDESRKNLFDWDLLSRLKNAGFAIYHFSLPLVFKRIHDDQFFEKKSRFQYVKSCYKLQKSIRLRLKKSWFYHFVFLGLFFYRILPWNIRLFLGRLRGHLK